jgi:hypothetical protein
MSGPRQWEYCSVFVAAGGRTDAESAPAAVVMVHVAGRNSNRSRQLDATGKAPLEHGWHRRYDTIRFDRLPRK